MSHREDCFPTGQSSLRYIMKTKNKIVTRKRKDFYQIVKEDATAYGLPSLNTKELIAILIGPSADMDVCTELASLTPDRFASLTEVELQSTYGLPKVAAGRLVAAIALSKRSDESSKEKIAAPQDVVNALSFISNEEQEHFVILLLNNRNKIKNKIVITKGTVNQTVIHAREVFKHAIRENATNIILGHNHPGGDPTPSKEDISVTRSLIKAGELLSITVLDHVIVAGNKHVSLKEQHIII